MYPCLDGRVIFRRDDAPYGRNWLELQEKRRERLERDPWYCFMIAVAGRTAPFRKLEDFDEFYNGDMRNHLQSMRERDDKILTAITTEKTKMFVSLIGNIAQQQQLRFQTSTGTNAVMVTSAATETVSARDSDVNNFLRQMRQGANEPVSLQEFMANIDTALNNAMATTPAMPRLESDQIDIDWALVADNSLRVRYTIVLSSAFDAILTQLWTRVGVRMTQEQVVNHPSEPLRDLIATVVANEILSNMAVTMKSDVVLNLPEIQRRKSTALFALATMLDPNYRLDVGKAGVRSFSRVAFAD